MVERRRLYTSLFLTLALAAANLVAFNVLLAFWPTSRMDLTEDRLYSISPATRRILANLDEEVTVLGFFSKRTHPKLAPLVPQIEDMLAEYRALSGGKLRVELADPGANEDAESEAVDRYGVESTPFRLASKYETGIVNAYFAIVVRYADQYVRYGFDDLIEVEPLPDGDIDVRLRNLEYDLTRAIKKVVYGFRSTAELFERVSAPVRLTTVVTPNSLPEPLRKVVEAVRTAAAELEQKGGDKFEFEELDPDSSEELAASVYERFGARPMTLGLFSDAQFYLYGFLESGGRVEQLALTGEGVSAATIREAIEDSLQRQTPGFLKTVGVVVPAPSLPPEVLMQLQMQGQRVPQPPPEFEQIQTYLRRDYEVRTVDLSSSVPTEVDTLLLLKPQNFDEKQVYHLDQYLMRGGRVIVCAGRYEPRFDPSTGLTLTPVTTGLEDWLRHFGVEVAQRLVLDDRNQPLPVPEIKRTPLGMLQTWRLEPYPYLVEVRDEGLLQREITSRLDGVGIYWGSPIQLEQPAQQEGQPQQETRPEVIRILQSSPQSWTDTDVSRVSYVDYTVPAEGLAPQLLAVALNGKFESYFRDREPPTRAADAGSGEQADASASAPTDVALEQSPDTRLVVVGDAAFVSDLVARALSLDGGFFASNLAFVQNLIDWVGLDNDMLSIRSRGTGVRRIERLDRATEVSVEWANYMIPTVLLVAWGMQRFWRRRRVAPIVGQPGTSHASTPRRAEG